MFHFCTHKSDFFELVDCIVIYHLIDIGHNINTSEDEFLVVHQVLSNLSKSTR